MMNQTQANNQRPTTSRPNQQLINYTKSLLDPFLNSVTQPKIYDGKVLRSAGARFRTTGDVTAYGTTYLVLAPALTGPLTWYGNNDSGVWSVGIPVDTIEHVSTPFQRSIIEKVRLVGLGLKLNLMNSADQNEGYWEAARFSTNHQDFEVNGDGYDGKTKHKDLKIAVPIELSNEPSYQRGKLRDIHRYMFRLNSNNTEHNLAKLSSDAVAFPPVEQMIDEDWDMIIIKIHGRVDATSPSVLNYEIVNNQEIVYKPNTAISRLMTPSPFIPQTPTIMGKIKVGMPGLKIE